MAEIRIEKKKPVWPWLLLGLLLVGLLVWLVADTDEDYDEIEETASVSEVETYDTDMVAEAPVVIPEVTQYVEMVDKNINMDLSHETSHKLLTSLADAIQATATKINYDPIQDNAFKEMKDWADKIKKDPMAGTHANSIKKALDNATVAIQNMQQTMPDVQNNSQKLQQELEDIDPATLTLDQKPDIKSYLREAGDALVLLQNNADKVVIIE
jgi:hypothetical protein